MINSTRENVSKSFKVVLVFFIISLLFKPIWLFNNQDLGNLGNDDLSYWMHAATIVYDYDIDYKDDYIVSTGIFNKVTNTPYQPPGAGYMSAPFVMLLSFFDETEPSRTNPVGSYAYLGFFGASLFYCFFGIYLINRTLRIKNYSTNSFLIFSILISTLVHFVGTRFVMSHAVEFFLCAYLCYLFETKDNLFSNRTLFFVTLTFLILSFTRPSTFLYSLFLIVIYVERKDYNLLNLIKAVSCFSILGLTHMGISYKLYHTLTIFQNYQTNLQEQGYQEFNAIFILKNSYKIVDLMFSPSMGLIWTMPVVAFGIFSLFSNYNFWRTENVLSRIFTLIYLYGAFIVLIIWQGREVSYGQRLLIGILPFCAVKLAEYGKFFYLNILFKFFTIISYLGYLYLYTSNNLKLKKGITLWGSEVGFAGQDYFLFLFKEFFILENIISFFGRTIYSVNVFNFTTIEKVTSILSLDQILTDEKILKVSELTSLYSNVDKGYLFTTNILILIFCFSITQVILQNRDRCKEIH